MSSETREMTHLRQIRAGKASRGRGKKKTDVTFSRNVVDPNLEQ